MGGAVAGGAWGGPRGGGAFVWLRIWLVAWMSSCALALLARLASSILKSSAVSANTPLVAQSTPP